MICTMYTRRQIAWIGILGCAITLTVVATKDVSGDELNLPIAEGPFTPTPDSLEKYEYPGLVPRRQIRHLGPLGAAGGADGRRLVRPRHV